MLNAINNSVGTSEVTQPEQKVSKNIAYRGGADYERTPYADSFESEEKKSSAGKTVGIIASVLAAAALVVGGICLHKGGKALEGAEEAEKTFGKKLKKGWEELWHSGEKAAKEGAENAKGAGEGATPAAEAPKTEATPPATPAAEAPKPEATPPTTPAAEAPKPEATPSAAPAETPEKPAGA